MNMQNVGTGTFPIIGIGASAGGLDAFHSFFDHMPPDSGMAFVMILHLPAGRKSMLTDILGRWTTMRVVEGTHGIEVEPNCVYVPAPHAVVTLADGHLGVRAPEFNAARVFRPIDNFFDSLATALGEDAVGIVLSGTGSDGALGLKAIKEVGGLTLAQGVNGTSPQYGEMPAGAIATGAVDIVAPVEEMPGHLLRMRGRASDIRVHSATVDTETLRLQICAILRAQLGHDFSGYRQNTFMRRVNRRMLVVGASSITDYVTRMNTDHDEVILLFRDLLIRVTSFFRDSETFELLKEKVIPELFKSKQADSSVRLWVPGCATGEEAFSLAILLREHMETLRGPPKVQIFATDIDEAAIVTARLGRYPPTLLGGLSPERREKFFLRSQGGYMVCKEIRDLCTFSTHNLVRDPPFSRMDLVSCRNLLIYMDTELQSAVIPVFHYALVRHGVLLLGGSESTARHQDLFEPLDKDARIFKKRDVRSPALNLSLERPNLHAAWSYLYPNTGSPRISQISHQYHNESLPSMPKNGAPTDSSKLPSEHPPAPRPSSWIARLTSRFFRTAARVADPANQLASAHEQLQSLAEEHQTALEELRSTNEELHSVNEEMQSTNEELETSKEELQSLNEELHTVNVRLTEKVSELDQSNGDLRNLFESTEIATIFLDSDLIIRSFTPAIGSLYNLISADRGRPLTDLASQLNYTGLTEDVARVLRTLVPLERRISRKDRSSHYIMRILPYREPDSSVSGVIMTFVDVTSIVQAEEALVEADKRKDVFLATLSHELRNPLAPIRTSARLLQSPNLSEEQLTRAQSIITRQVTHMSSLLDDLLDVSRITRGVFPLKKELVDINSLIAAAVESVQPAVDAKRHQLIVEESTEPVMLEADSVRLTQIVSNLLANATKYTPHGGVITLGSYLDSVALHVYVRDNGIGLAADSLTAVFSMFTRIDADVDRSEGGLGIGLALAKGLAELHGGRIDARSAGLGQGSEFVLILPRDLVVAVPVATDVRVEPAAQSSRTVLVADDNRDGAESLSMFIETLGHQVHVAHTGSEALEMAASIKPDIGIFDIGMPGMNGYELALRVRQEAWGRTMQLIALTGWGQDTDRAKAQEAGFDHHLTKPVDLDKLERLFHDAVADKAD